MPINVPESVFDKYYDVIDSTFTIFGVTCQLVFVEQIEEISNAYNNVPDNRSINAHRKNQEQFRRENKVFREVERTEDIKLKVYWDNKSWIKPVGNLVYPDNAIQTIFFATDLAKINRAKELIVHKTIKDIQGPMKYKKIGQPFPVGLRQDRYFACFWG
jgi:hypothetical protein